jgi:hypothetical protein
VIDRLPAVKGRSRGKTESIEATFRPQEVASDEDRTNEIQRSHFRDEKEEEEKMEEEEVEEREGEMMQIIEDERKWKYCR